MQNICTKHHRFVLSVQLFFRKLQIQEEGLSVEFQPSFPARERSPCMVRFNLNKFEHPWVGTTYVGRRFGEGGPHVCRGTGTGASWIPMWVEGPM